MDSFVQLYFDTLEKVETTIQSILFLQNRFEKLTHDLLIRYRHDLPNKGEFEMNIMSIHPQTPLRHHFKRDLKKCEMSAAIDR